VDGSLPAPDEATRPPRSLLARLAADPARAAEHLALAAARQHAPAAAAWLAERRAFYADDPRELARMAVKRHVNLARLGGAATGFGGIATVIPDLAAQAWIQSRMVFFIAAAHRLDPHDPMRPAEYLVIQGLYADPPAARRALDGVGPGIATAWAGSRAARQEKLYRTLARLTGRTAGRRLGGRAIPVFAVAANALGNARESKALGNRAIAFYRGLHPGG
jgi:EcsC protein family